MSILVYSFRCFHCGGLAPLSLHCGDTEHPARVGVVRQGFSLPGNWKKGEGEGEKKGERVKRLSPSNPYAQSPTFSPWASIAH